LKWWRVLLRSLKNKVGDIRGYGNCAHCGDSWMFKEYIDLSCSEDQRIFPICKECFNKLSDEEVLGYCRDLWLAWSVNVPEDYTSDNFPSAYLMNSIKLARNR